MQRFNSINTESNFIKNLLATTYIPMERTVREGDYLCEGQDYIFQTEAIHCSKSGYINNYKYLNLYPAAQWEPIRRMHFWDRDNKLSTNFISNSAGYDFKTHERLGKYLRALRDLYELNLLPLYNCFSNHLISGYHIFSDRITYTTQDYNTKLYAVPIRFNTDYTVCMDNVGTTTFAPVFLKYDQLLKQDNTKFGNNIDVSNQYINLHHHDNILSYANTSFKQPIKLRFNNIPQRVKRRVWDFKETEEFKPIPYIGNEAIYTLRNYFYPTTINESNYDPEAHYYNFGKEDINGDGEYNPLEKISRIRHRDPVPGHMFIKDEYITYELALADVAKANRSFADIDELEDLPDDTYSISIRNAETNAVIRDRKIYFEKDFSNPIYPDPTTGNYMVDKKSLANSLNNTIDWDGGTLKVLKKEAYAIYNRANKTLTFTRDEIGKYVDSFEQGYDVYFTGIEWDNIEKPSWIKYKELNTEIIINKIIFEDIIKPGNSMAYWFAIPELTEIENLENLNTDNVRYIDHLFDGCNNSDIVNNLMTRLQNISILSDISEEAYTIRKAPQFTDDYNREVDIITGGTVAWNQLSRIANGTKTDRGVTASIDSNGLVTLSGTSKTTYTACFDGFNAIKGHKYIGILTVVANPNNVTLKARAFNINWTTGNMCDANSTVLTGCGVTGFAANTDLSGIKLMWNCHDLTAMFGTTIADYIYTLEQGTAGAGVAWFKALFPKSYYQYNAGELMSVSGLQSHDTIGFNQWDEQWEVGSIAQTTGRPNANVAPNTFRSKNYCRCLPGVIYHFEHSQTQVYVYWYDNEKNFIRYHNISTPKNQTSPVSAAYFKIDCRDSSIYNNDICINLSWSGYRNGEYEPYSKHSYPLDSTLTLRGVPKLDASGSLYYDGDTYEADGTVTRKYGIVDLGTLNWVATSHNRLSTVGAFSTAKKPSAYADVANLVCAIYQADSDRNVANNVNNKAITIGQDNKIYVYDTAYTDAADFKTAMSGVMLAYELATETTENATGFINPQVIDKYGTEQYITDSILPVGHNTRYAYYNYKPLSFTKTLSAVSTFANCVNCTELNLTGFDFIDEDISKEGITAHYSTDIKDIFSNTELTSESVSVPNSWETKTFINEGNARYYFNYTTPVTDVDQPKFLQKHYYLDGNLYFDIEDKTLYKCESPEALEWYEFNGLNYVPTTDKYMKFGISHIVSKTATGDGTTTEFDVLEDDIECALTKVTVDDVEITIQVVDTIEELESTNVAIIDGVVVFGTAPDDESEIEIHYMYFEDKTYYRKVYKREKLTKVYDVKEEDCKFYSDIESHLYLFIQVPKNYNKSISIIEGDYTSTQCNRLIDQSILNYYPNSLYDTAVAHDLRLMQMGSEEYMPYSPTLIQFLLWNALNHLDVINNNMDRLKIRLDEVLPTLETPLYNKNFWMPAYRKYLSDFANSEQTPYIEDNIGYLTTKIEKALFTNKDY